MMHLSFSSPPKRSKLPVNTFSKPVKHQKKEKNNLFRIHPATNMRQWCNLGLAVISQGDPPSILPATHQWATTQHWGHFSTLHCNGFIFGRGQHSLRPSHPMFALLPKKQQVFLVLIFIVVSPFSSSVCYFSCWPAAADSWLASTKRYCLSRPPPSQFLLPSSSSLLPIESFCSYN